MQNKNINYFTNKEFLNSNIVYGFFTRNGGCSKKPFDSLNCSLNNKDNKDDVKNNIFIAKKILGLEKTYLKFSSQVHGINIEIINYNNIKEKIIADGIMTQDKNISLAILTADCAPVFLIDKNTTFICALHIGWKGCLYNIVKSISLKFNKITKSKNNLTAIIGPCLNQSNFEVDQNFRKIFMHKFSYYEKFFTKKTEGSKYLFNMRDLIEYQLKKISINKIFHVNNDTFSEEKLFYSHRRITKNKESCTGRMINIIGFRQ